jgi:3-methyladenine DNA glycosylase AlkD
MTTTSTVSSVHAEILAFCQTHADPALVIKYSRYFKEGGYDAWGVPYSLMQEKVKSILDDPGTDLAFIMELSRKLIPGTKYEEPSYALMLVKAMKKHYTRDTFAGIGNWFDIGIRNWAHCDALCSEIISVFLQRLIPFGEMEAWKSGTNKFQRRAVPVALIKLMKTTGNVMQYVEFIEPLMYDKEREVHQGVGWFLREAWKIKPGPVENFLLIYKDTAPRLIFQYATEKMTKENKERFRKEKK